MQRKAGLRLKVRDDVPLMLELRVQLKEQTGIPSSEVLLQLGQHLTLVYIAAR